MKRRKIRLSPRREAWAAERDSHTFAGTPLNPPDVVEAKFRAQLEAMVDRMNAATRRELERLYRTPEGRAATVAMDASFSSMAAKLVRELTKRFTALFVDRAGGLAKAWAEGISRQSAVGLGQSLKDVSGGVTLKTDVVSGVVADVVRASIKQNVALIKSIPAKFFLEIEGEVMRSIQTGRGMADLQPFLEARYGISKRRAALIARDQTSKATTAINRARMQGLGVKKFKWLHSMGGKEPRPLHKNTLNGKVFSMDDPPVIDERTGERGFPGQLINCFTGSTKVSLANGCRNLWRYRHSGDIIEISVEGHAIFEATPNHPILTGRGWLPANEIQEGDYLASSEPHDLGVVNGHNAENTVTFADLYVALVLAQDAETSSGAEFNFHGDVPEGEVDSVLVEKDLALRLKTGGAHEVKKLILAGTDRGGLNTSPSIHAEVFHSLGSGAAGEVGPLVSGELGQTHATSAAPVTQDDACTGQNIADHLTRTSVNLGNFQDAGAVFVEGNDGIGLATAGTGGYLSRDFVLKAGLECGAKTVSAALMGLAETAQRHPTIKGFHRVTKKVISVFDGHVYTMETEEGWYPLAATATISKNCRCRMVPVIEFKSEEVK